MNNSKQATSERIHKQPEMKNLLLELDVTSTKLRDLRHLLFEVENQDMTVRELRTALFDLQ